MSLDRRNTVVVSIACVIAAVSLALLGVAANNHATTEHQTTERARVAGCRTIEDEGLRALCLTHKP